MKKWYIELNIDEELNDKLKKLINLTGEDDEEIVLKSLKVKRKEVEHLADLFVTNLAGQSEMLTDFNNLTRKRRVNGERSLSFFVMQTPSNTHAIPLVCEESIVEYDGAEYRIKNVEERTIVNTPVKDVTATHVFFDIVDVFQYGTCSRMERSRLTNYCRLRSAEQAGPFR
jgi:hypothetical protein